MATRLGKLGLFALLALALSCEGNPEKTAPVAADDFDAFCTLASVHFKEHGLANDRYRDFAVALHGIKVSTPAGAEAQSAFLSAAPGFRYRFMEEGAAKSGKRGWSCEALKKLDQVAGE